MIGRVGVKDDAARFTRETGIPLDQDVTEQIPVRKNVFDQKTGTVRSTVQLENVTVRYIHSPKDKVSCNRGEHDFHVVDNRKWLFACRSCAIQKKVTPFSHKFINGKLISKRTNLPE